MPIIMITSRSTDYIQPLSHPENVKPVSSAPAHKTHLTSRLNLTHNRQQRQQRYNKLAIRHAPISHESEKLTSPHRQYKRRNRERRLCIPSPTNPHHPHNRRRHPRNRPHQRNSKPTPALHKLLRVPAILLPQPEHPFDPRVLRADAAGVRVCVEDFLQGEVVEGYDFRTGGGCVLGGVSSELRRAKGKGCVRRGV